VLPLTFPGPSSCPLPVRRDLCPSVKISGSPRRGRAVHIGVRWLATAAARQRRIRACMAALRPRGTSSPRDSLPSHSLRSPTPPPPPRPRRRPPLSPRGRFPSRCLASTARRRFRGRTRPMMAAPSQGLRPLRGPRTRGPICGRWVVPCRPDRSPTAQAVGGPVEAAGPRPGLLQRRGCAPGGAHLPPVPWRRHRTPAPPQRSPPEGVAVCARPSMCRHACVPVEANCESGDPAGGHGPGVAPPRGRRRRRRPFPRTGPCRTASVRTSPAPSRRKELRRGWDTYATSWTDKRPEVGIRSQEAAGGSPRPTPRASRTKPRVGAPGLVLVFVVQVLRYIPPASLPRPPAWCQADRTLTAAVVSAYDPERRWPRGAELPGAHGVDRWFRMWYHVRDE
jgi:hypothetical protein